MRASRSHARRGRTDAGAATRALRNQLRTGAAVVRALPLIVEFNLPLDCDLIIVNCRVTAGWTGDDARRARRAVDAGPPEGRVLLAPSHSSARVAPHWTQAHRRQRQRSTLLTLTKRSAIAHTLQCNVFFCNRSTPSVTAQRSCFQECCVTTTESRTTSRS